jgi:hypothetical protein
VFLTCSPASSCCIILEAVQALLCHIVGLRAMPAYAACSSRRVGIQPGALAAGHARAAWCVHSSMLLLENLADEYKFCLCRWSGSMNFACSTAVVQPEAGRQGSSSTVAQQHQICSSCTPSALSSNSQIYVISFCCMNMRQTVIWSLAAGHLPTRMDLQLLTWTWAFASTWCRLLGSARWRKE